MSTEREETAPAPTTPTQSTFEPRPLRSIHVDLDARALTLVSDQAAARLTWSPRGPLLELLAGDNALPPAPAARLAVASPEGGSGSRERDAAVVRTGRLMSEVKRGRPDSRGNETAWTRFAAHEDDEDAAHLYLLSFHRGSVRTALTLSQGDRVTVEGYLKRSSDPDRLDAFSAFVLHDYPGKPPKVEE